MKKLYQVVGIQKSISKKTNREYTLLHLLSDFPEHSSAQGSMAENIYVPKNVDVYIDDMIELVYGVGFGGKAVVEDVIRVESAN